MSLIRKLAEHLWAILSGYNRLGLRLAYLEEEVRRSDARVERSLNIINSEMGSLDRRMGHLAEDMAYLRGRLDIDASS